MNSQKVLIQNVNPHLICILCGGYFIDATAVTECLHAFCKSCIVRYLETSKFCPVCDVLVHKKKPLSSIRPDYILQSLVYKIVPGLYKSELKRRKKFYANHKHVASKIPCINDSYFSWFVFPEELISLALQMCTDVMDYDSAGEKRLPPIEDSLRYFQCPAAVSVSHIKKLIRGKYDLSLSLPIGIFAEDGEELEESLTLIDVIYIKRWIRSKPLLLKYKLYESKKMKMEEKETPLVTSLSGGIVEDLKKSVPELSSSSESSFLKDDAQSILDLHQSTAALILTRPSSTVLPHTNSNSFNSGFCEVSQLVPSNLQLSEATNALCSATDAADSSSVIKTSDNNDRIVDKMIVKQSEVLWKEVELKISENGIMSVSGVESIMEDILNTVVKPEACELLCKMENETSINDDDKNFIRKSVDEFQNALVPLKNESLSISVSSHKSICIENSKNGVKIEDSIEKQEGKVQHFSASVEEDRNKKQKRKVVYKTLKKPPKAWNPTLSRDQLPLRTPTSNAKFFKARNRERLMKAVSDKKQIITDRSISSSDTEMKENNNTGVPDSSNLKHIIENTCILDECKIPDSVSCCSSSVNSFTEKVSSPITSPPQTSTQVFLNTSSAVSNPLVAYGVNSKSCMHSQSTCCVVSSCMKVPILSTSSESLLQNGILPANGNSSVSSEQAQKYGNGNCDSSHQAHCSSTNTLDNCISSLIIPSSSAARTTADLVSTCKEAYTSLKSHYTVTGSCNTSVNNSVSSIVSQKSLKTKSTYCMPIENQHQSNSICNNATSCTSSTVTVSHPVSHTSVANSYSFNHHTVHSSTMTGPLQKNTAFAPAENSWEPSHASNSNFNSKIQSSYCGQLFHPNTNTLSNSMNYSCSTHGAVAACNHSTYSHMSGSFPCSSSNIYSSPSYSQPSNNSFTCASNYFGFPFFSSNCYGSPFASCSPFSYNTSFFQNLYLNSSYKSASSLSFFPPCHNNNNANNSGRGSFSSLPFSSHFSTNQPKNSYMQQSDFTKNTLGKPNKVKYNYEESNCQCSSSSKLQ